MLNCPKAGATKENVELWKKQQEKQREQKNNNKQTNQPKKKHNKKQNTNTGNLIYKFFIPYFQHLQHNFEM